MVKPVRFAVAGCGWWATEHHIPAIVAHPDADLVAAADPDPERRNLVSDRYKIDVFSDWESLLDAGSVDALVVSSPNYTHVKIASAAVQAGLSVLIEKPMGIHGAKARQLIRHTAEPGQYILVGYPFQMTSTAARLRDFIKAEGLGDLELVTGVYTSSASLLFLRPDDREGPLASTYAAEAAGGGQGHTQVTHLLSCLLWTTGLQVSRVAASMRFADGPPLDTVYTSLVDFDSGGRATLASVGTVPRGASRVQEIRYFGARGMATHDLITAKVDIVLHDGETLNYCLKEDESAYPTTRPVSILIQLMNGERTSNPGSPEVAAHTVEVLEAAYLSVADGRPVEISSLEHCNRVDGR